MFHVLRLAKEIRSVRFYPLLSHIFVPYQRRFAPGDLVYLNAAGQPVVIINSPRVGVALLDRRAAIYSDRPRSIVGSDIMCGGLAFAFSHYDDT